MGGDKAVLISIKPEWCAYICDEEKDTEVRKNTPSLQCPFKVYIYCTKHGDRTGLSRVYGDGEARMMIGKVIGEFMCDRFTCIQVRREDNGIHLGNTAFLRTCLYDAELIEYLTNGKINVDAEGWGWHISKLKIYADPRELTRFNYYGKREHINRPPQSWCYVEDLGW